MYYYSVVKMQYYLIHSDDDTQFLQEVFNGIVQRYCDIDGNTIHDPVCGYSVIGEYTPAFTPPPDPVVCAQPDLIAPVIAPTITQTPVAPIEILGAPIRVFGYDDKNQIVRIDYPTIGKYQMLEYKDGRLRKITEISPDGVQFERHWYYDEWGRPQEETQL